MLQFGAIKPQQEKKTQLDDTIKKKLDLKGWRKKYDENISICFIWGKLCSSHRSTHLHISVCAKILHPSSEAEAFVDVEAAFMSRLHFVRFNLYLLINKGVEPDTKLWHTWWWSPIVCLAHRSTVTFSDNWFSRRSRLHFPYRDIFINN